MIRIKVRGLNQVVKRFKDAPNKIRRIFPRLMNELGQKGKKDVQMIINRGGYGSYRAVDTGAMRDGLTMRSSLMKAVISTSPKTDYARYVHDGTYKMRSRPFMTATKKKLESTNELERIVIKYLKEI